MHIPISPYHPLFPPRIFPCRLARYDGYFSPHTYGVRYCPCGLFATEPCRPTACIPWGTSLTDNCQLTTDNWFYTFSAKERDNVMRMAFAVLPVLSAKQLHDSPFVDCEEDPQIEEEQGSVHTQSCP